MPGITKKRKICHVPESRTFTPDHPTGEPVILTLDELEALRLSDFEQMDQDSAAELMEISRTTFQRVVHTARKRIATALVEGKTIQIGGGKYAVSDNHCGNDPSCSICRFEPDDDPTESLDRPNPDE